MLLSSLFPALWADHMKSAGENMPSISDSQDAML